MRTNEIKLTSKGFFALSVLNKDGQPVPEKTITKSNNVVTYDGAFDMFFGTGMFAVMYAVIGTGTTEITRDAHELTSRFPATSGGGSVSRDGNEIDNGDGTSTLTLTRTMSFNMGDTVGTFSEVGISRSSNGSNLIAGQLIKDEFGNPTTITVLADEQLVVSYTLEITVPNGATAEAPLVASGIVTTPEGDVGYEIFTQPFFCQYAVNNASKDIRLNKINGSAAFAGNSGVTENTANVSTPQVVHNGQGVVTVTLGSGTVSPSAFNMSEIVYQAIGGAINNSTTYNNVDPVTKRVPNHEMSYHVVVVKFTPGILKDSTRSFKNTIELVYSI